MPGVSVLTVAVSDHQLHAHFIECEKAESKQTEILHRLSQLSPKRSFRNTRNGLRSKLKMIVSTVGRKYKRHCMGTTQYWLYQAVLHN